MKQKRTARELSVIVEKTIKEIRGYNNLTDDLIIKICEKNNISENHIRTVAGWKKM